MQMEAQADAHNTGPGGAGMECLLTPVVHLAVREGQFRPCQKRNPKDMALS